jgi:hypothetical protein
VTVRGRRTEACLGGRGHRLGPVVLAAAAASWPQAAIACGSCFLESELTRQAYYGTTILMIAVPLLIAAGIGAWLYRATRRRAPDSS